MAHRESRPSHSPSPQPSPQNGLPPRGAAEAAGDFLGLDAEVRGHVAHPNATPMPPSTPSPATSYVPASQRLAHPHGQHTTPSHLQSHTQPHMQPHAQSHAQSHVAQPGAHAPRAAEAHATGRTQGPRPIAPGAPHGYATHAESAAALQWLDDATTAVLEETRFREQAQRDALSTSPARPQPNHAAAISPTPTYAPPPMQAAPSTSWSGLMQPGAVEVPPAPVARPNSWLLELDDARAGRAGLDPVVRDPSRALEAPRAPAPLDASFSEAPPVVERTMPWIVRGLIACAAASFVVVVGWTLTRPRMTEPKPQEVPQPVATRVNTTPVQLDDPRAGRTSLPRGNGRDVTNGDGSGTPLANERTPVLPASPQRPVTPRGATHVPRAGAVANANGNANTIRNDVPYTPPVRPLLPEAPPVQIEIPPAEFAPDYRTTPLPTPSSNPMSPSNSLPSPGNARLDAPVNGAQDGVVAAGIVPNLAWFPGAQRTTPLATSEWGPRPDELAASPDRRERVDRWLMMQSRSSAPALDASADYVPPTATSLGSLARAEANGAVVDAASTRDVETPGTNATPPATNAVVGARWEGAVVPVEQIDARSRVLTPKVGRVRVALSGGDSFEGVLYAVGEGRVWIDAEGGRIALAREQIERLEQIATPSPKTADVAVVPEPVVSEPTARAVVAPPSTPEPRPATPAPLDPNARVRVRTPGGLFYGRIVSREGEAITLITDEGARVTVDSTDVEAAPERKTLVKRPSTRPAKKTAPKPTNESAAPSGGITEGSADGSHPPTPH